MVTFYLVEHTDVIRRTLLSEIQFIVLELSDFTWDMDKLIMLYNDNEEYNCLKPCVDYEKIVNGDYTLANKYLQTEIERTNRLLAFKLITNKRKNSTGLNTCHPSTSMSNYASVMSKLENQSIIYHSLQTQTDKDEDIPEENSALSSRWTETETKQLIELYASNFEKFNNGKYRPKSIYTVIAQHFVRFTSEQVERRGRITWPFFQSMEEILGRKPENDPLSIASNVSGYHTSQFHLSEGDVNDSNNTDDGKLPERTKYKENAKILKNPHGSSSTEKK